MKKIYLSLVAMAIAAGAGAQNVPFANAKQKATVNEVALEAPSFNPSVGATGDTINNLYYDFSTPANWVFGNDGNPSADWEITSTGPTGGFSESYGPLESSSAANGWAMFDSDALGSNSSVQNAWIQLANPVDLSGYSSVAVVFQQFYTRFQDNVYLEVSVDGTAWTTYEVNTDVAGNASSDNPDLRVINISGAAGGQSTVWIRFRFQGGWDYFWQLDDVAFVEGAANDLEISNVWHGDILNDYEYQQTPLAQAQEIVIGVASTNLGGEAQTNAVYTYDISDANGSVSSGTFAATLTSIPSTSADTTWYATGFTPSATGDYVVTVSVAADQTDELPDNNEGASNFSITESIYAHDDIDNIEFQIYGGLDDSNVPNEYKAGLIYAMNADATLYAVQVAFGANTTTATCFVDVYNTVDLDNPIVSEVYDLQTGDVSTGSAISLVNILIDGGNGIDLTAGQSYLLSVGNSAGENLWILASDGDDDLGGLRYGPFGAGGAVNWYTGYTTSPIIRANFDPAASVQENEDVSGVLMYPNPANSDFTVSFVAKEDQDMTVNILGANGALVLSEQIIAKVGQNSTVNFNVAGLASGIYMVQLQGASSSLTQRFVVQ